MPIVNAVLFETDGHHVTEISVGDKGWIGLIEGCA